MNFFTPLTKLTRLTVITLSLLSAFTNIEAQVRSYNLVYSDNVQGSTALIGNTLLNIVDNGVVNTTKMNGNSANGNSTYGNNNENMQYIDIDGSTGNGSVTRNSSSADLILPSGANTIKLARLYWGGFVVNSDFDLTAPANRKIKIRKGTTSAYLDVTALGLDTSKLNSTSALYQAYADVTSLVKTNGAGTYEVGNIPASVGKFVGGGYGAWCIVVVYENPALPYNSIRIYDGFRQVYNEGSQATTSVTLTGLNIPSGALTSADAKMGIVSWEGDAQLKADFLKINGNLFSNVTNQSDNPWNGTITDNGVHVTAKNPNYTNQMGVDIDQFDIGTGYEIYPNATSVTLQFGTESDRYFPGLFTFAIKMKDPAITLDKTVADANNDNYGERNEVLTYTLKGKNTGAGNANSIIITDTLPSTITYVPNSLEIVSSPGIAPGINTDASGDDNAEYIVNGSIKTVRFRIGTGSTASAGGTLAANETYEVRFKATVNDMGPGNFGGAIINIARIMALSDANVDFVDDGTAILNPEYSAMPVTLVLFAGTLLPDNKTKIDWSTSMEINCREYNVERSIDGKIFYKIETVAGSGTTPYKHSYSITDDASSVTSSMVYYRLRQLDFDGKSSYSKVVAVKLKSLNKEINISPNPFTSYLNVNMEWSSNEIITVKVINVQGKEVVSKNIQMSKGLNYISIDELSKLSAGNYFIQFISSTERTTKKITKQ
ncbi:MAG: T9SS type A sorting domain-containing protein [Ginsengibacter sp.]